MTGGASLDAAHTREKILATAERLFSAQGYEQTPLSQVARLAQVSKALVLWHFESKEQLYRAALNRTLESYVLDTHEVDGLDERAQVERFIDQFCEFVHDNVYSVRFFLSLTLRAEGHPDAGLERVLGLYQAFRSSFATVIESGRARGVFRADTDPSRDADLIMATLAGILVQQFLSAESEHDSAALIAYLKTTLFQRLLPSGAGSTPAGRP